MGILDKLKGLVSGREKDVAQGVDKTADVAKDKVGHDEQVDKAADTVKDKLGEGDARKREQ
jgi:hypothetical protein